MVNKKQKKKLRREKVLFIRVTPSEKELVRKRAAAQDLTLEEYGRCKVFDIPFEHISGRVSKTPADPSHIQNQATQATA